MFESNINLMFDILGDWTLGEEMVITYFFIRAVEAILFTA